METTVRILIIDDNESDCEFYERCLKKWQKENREIEKSFSGREAIERLKASTFDLVIIDYNLPDTNGIDFIDRMWNELGEQTPAILMISGEGNETIASQAIKSGAHDYLIKGHIKSESLIHAVNNAVSKHEMEKQIRSQKMELMKKACAIETSTDAFISCDLEGRVVSYNQGATEVYGYEREEIFGKKVSMLTPEDRQHEFPELFNKVIQGESVQHHVTERMHKSGRIIHVSLSLSPIMDERGRVIEVASFSRDISEQKRIEAELKELSEEVSAKNRELEDTNQYLSEFSHTVAHDLKNPVGLIQSFLEMLQPGSEMEGSIDKADVIERCVNSAKRMSRLITDLLNFGRDTKIKGAVEDIDLNVTIEEVLCDLENVIKEKNADVQVGSMPSIMGNKSQIYQVFLNLINNALKFTRKEVKAVIKIDAEKVPRHYHKTEKGDVELCKIVVSDNGIGIQEKDLKKIFLAFNRVHGSKEIEGSGIGLATVKRIVSFHSGNIVAQSEVGEGSSFIITMPVQLSEDASTFIRKELRMMCRDNKVIKTKVYQSENLDLSFTVLDESETGMRCQSSNPSNLFVGDILKVHKDHSYEIRWLKELSEKGVEFGLKALR